MTTKWTFPTLFEQYAELGGETTHISWNEGNNFSALKDTNGNFLSTTKQLLHIARSPKLDITNKTYYLRTSGFNFVNLPESITGIELRLTMDRRGRIMDDVISLSIGRDFIGKNQGNTNLLPIKIYGSDTDLWDIDTLTTADLQDSQFGITLRFKSHPAWPHRDLAAIDSIELRIH